jgi:hypothetical protein
MTRPMKLISVAAGPLLILGCGLAVDLVQPRLITVRLINNGDFPVDTVILTSDQRQIPRTLLRQVGSRVEHTVDPGQTISFTRDCEDLRAIMLDDADLRVVGAVGPSTSTGVLRYNDDFECRDTIAFTFDHSILLVDFDVTVDVFR